MKKWIVLGALGLVMLVSMVTADSFQPRTYMAYVDTITVNNLYTASAWDSVTNVIVDRIDTSYVIAKVHGLVYLTPHDRLYVGIDDDTTAGAVTVPEDTGIYRFTTYDHNPDWMSFTYTQKVDLATGAANDTLFLLMSLGAGGKTLQVKNITFEAVVMDSAT